MIQKFQTPKMQAFGAAVGVVTIIVAIVYLFVWNRTSEKKVELPKEDDGTTEVVTQKPTTLDTVVKTKKIAAGCKPHTESKNAGTPFASIDLLYPQICDSAFDGTIEYIVDTLAKEMAERAKEEVPGYRTVSGRTDASYALAIEPFQIFFNDNIASALLSVSQDTGGAHSGTTFYTVSIDRKNQSRITLNTLFSEKSKYLNELSKIATKKLSASIGVDELSKEGVAPIEENFSRFTLTDKDITFHFPPYQVAAYAAGPQEITIPFSELGPYWKATNSAQ